MSFFVIVKIERTFTRSHIKRPWKRKSDNITAEAFEPNSDVVTEKGSQILKERGFKVMEVYDYDKGIKILKRRSIYGKKIKKIQDFMVIKK